MAKAYLYDAEGHDQEVEVSAKSLAAIGQEQLLWIDIERSDRETLAKLATLLDIGKEASALIANPPSPPQLDKFGAHYQFSAPLPPKPGRLPSARLDFLVADRWLMTVRDGDVEFFIQFREQDKAETLTGRLTPAALAAALLDWHLESYHSELAAIEIAVDDLDEAVLQSRKQRPPLSALGAMRRRVSNLRIAIDAHRSIIHGLLRADFSPIVESPDEQLYRALERRFNRLEDGAERARELVVGSFDLYAARTAQDTNLSVKTLTLVTIVIGLIGAVAGVFGMNFDTPLNRAGVPGFLAVLGAMAAIGGGVVIVAKWRKWV